MNDTVEILKNQGKKLRGRGVLSDAEPVSKKRDLFKKMLTWALGGALLIGAVITASHLQRTKGVVQSPAQTKPLFHTLPDLINATRGSVVHVEKIGECQGSGVAIKNNVVMTARHVTDGDDHITAQYIVTTDAGESFEVVQVIEDTQNDLSFFMIREHVLIPSKVGAKDPRTGDMVIVFGSPLGFDNLNTASPGYVTGLDRDCYNRRGWEDVKYLELHQMIQTNAPAFPGNSGGPVFDLQGDIVGILVAVQDATLNFSVPASRFRECVDQIETLFMLSRYEILREKEVEVDLYNQYRFGPDGEVKHGNNCWRDININSTSIHSTWNVVK